MDASGTWRAPGIWCYRQRCLHTGSAGFRAYGLATLCDQEFGEGYARLTMHGRHGPCDVGFRHRSGISAEFGSGLVLVANQAPPLIQLAPLHGLTQ